MKRIISIGLLIFTCFVSAQEQNTLQQLDSLKQQLELAIKNKTVDEEITLRFEIFESHIKNVDYNQAYIDGLKLEEVISLNPNNETVIKTAPTFYKRMGWLLSAQVQYERSIQYYKKAIALAQEPNKEHFIFDSKSSIAFYSHLLGKKKQAHEIANSLMIQAKEKNDESMISQAHYLYYLLYNEEENYQKSLYHIKLSKPGSSKSAKAFRSINIGTGYLHTGNLDSALVYTLKGLKIAEDINEVQIQSNAHIQLRDIYLRLEDYKNAMEHTLKFEQISEKSGSYKSGMELVKINNDILQEKIKLQQELASGKIISQRITIWLTVLALIILTVSILYISNRLKLINDQKKIIELEKARAEQSEKYKEQFLANMSHEIRTPMHAISGITNTLLRNKHPKSQDAYLEAMKTSSDNLLVLLDDILDLSKIESGELKIEKSKINPHTIINNVIKTYNFRAQDKGIKLSSKISKDVPEKIIGDSTRLNQILTNLVGNAIKFTESGSIIVNLTIGKDKETLQFCVEDTGIGIDESKLESIFETFKQGKKSKSQIYKGTGLGLSIAKKLVEIQSGRIWVESKKNKGSKFCFELPLIVPSIKNAETELLLEKDISNLTENLTGLRVLLAEDDEFNIMVVQDDLNYFIKGLKLTIVNNGKEAIEQFQTNTFDIILMDMHMPELDGVEATQKIRALETATNQKRTPIVAMTANIVKSEIKRCLEAGMDDYIPKPYKQEQLIAKLALFVTGKIS